MNFSVSLFLLFFMLETSFSDEKAWITSRHDDYIDYEKLTYDPNTEVQSERAYVFLRNKCRYRRIVYLVGTQTTPYEKVMTAIGAVDLLENLYDARSNGVKLYFTRGTSDSVNKFADVLEKCENVFKNIPRLYRVEAGSIIQIPLNPELVDNKNAFVLHNGSAVTFYLPSSRDIIKKLTNGFTEFIIFFEETKYNVNTPITSNKLEATYEDFIGKIKEIVKFLPENGLRNIRTLNAEFSAKIDLTSDDDNYFETIRTIAIEHILNRLSQGATDSVDYDKVSNFGIASTSTSFAMEDEVVNRKEDVEISETRTPHVLTNFEVQTIINERPIIIFGPSQCQSEGGEQLYEYFKSSCVYIIGDLINNELTVYFGRKADKKDYQSAVIVAEGYYLYNNPSMKITYICDDGYPLPPHFMIYFKDKLNFLYVEASVDKDF